jgi:SAM-dependent methyltransferase
MAFLKIYRYARREGLPSALAKACRAAPPYLRRLPHWQIRRCGCCSRMSVFVSDRDSPEFKVCLFCSANERYELLAAEIEARYGPSLPQLDVLELDTHSPLRPLLSKAKTYTRTFYDASKAPGSLGPEGAKCEDVTGLTFADGSFDLIVSSEVLEHVPDLAKALGETARVLKPGGAHLFTVPPRGHTRKRAEIIDGDVRFLEPPDYHCDPLVPEGILAFWDIGADLPEVVDPAGLDLKIVRGPSGSDGRVVWMAQCR